MLQMSRDQYADLVQVMIMEFVDNEAPLQTADYETESRKAVDAILGHLGVIVEGESFILTRDNPWHEYVQIKDGRVVFQWIADDCDPVQIAPDGQEVVWSSDLIGLSLAQAIREGFYEPAYPLVHFGGQPLASSFGPDTWIFYHLGCDPKLSDIALTFDRSQCGAFVIEEMPAGRQIAFQGEGAEKGYLARYWDLNERAKLRQKWEADPTPPPENERDPDICYEQGCQCPKFHVHRDPTFP